MKIISIRYPHEQAKKENHSNIKCLEASFDTKKAQILTLLLKTHKKEHVLIDHRVNSRASEHFLKTSGMPQFFSEKRLHPFEKTKNFWNCQRFELLKKRGATSIRFFLVSPPLTSKQHQITLELTYTLNWLNHFVINYRLSALRQSAVMLPHPLFFCANEDTVMHLPTKNPTLWHQWEEKNEKNRFAYILKPIHDGKTKLKREASFTVVSQKNKISIDAYTSCQALDCGIRKSAGNKKSFFWINAFDFYTDNIVGKAVGTSLARSDIPFHSTPQHPFTLKNGVTYSYSTLFHLRLLQ